MSTPVKLVYNTETLSRKSAGCAASTDQLIVKLTTVSEGPKDDAPRRGSSALHPLLTDGHSQIPTRHWHCGVLKTGQAQPSPHQLYGQSNGLIGNILLPTVLYVVRSRSQDHAASPSPVTVSPSLTSP